MPLPPNTTKPPLARSTPPLRSGDLPSVGPPRFAPGPNGKVLFPIPGCSSVPLQAEGMPSSRCPWGWPCTLFPSRVLGGGPICGVVGRPRGCFPVFVCPGLFPIPGCSSVPLQAEGMPSSRCPWGWPCSLFTSRLLGGGPIWGVVGRPRGCFPVFGLAQADKH